MRFQTMAILQYARFKKLGYSTNESMSLGYTFALFYAIMKNKRWYGNKKKYDNKNQDNSTTKIEGQYQEEKNTMNIFGLNLEYVEVNGEKFFKMAGKICDLNQWKNGVVLKINNIDLYNKALDKAMEIINTVDETILKNNNKFFNKVYKPIRDEFFDMVEGKVMV